MKAKQGGGQMVNERCFYWMKTYLFDYAFTVPVYGIGLEAISGLKMAGAEIEKGEEKARASILSARREYPVCTVGGTVQLMFEQDAKGDRVRVTPYWKCDRCRPESIDVEFTEEKELKFDFEKRNVVLEERYRKTYVLSDSRLVTISFLDKEFIAATKQFNVALQSRISEKCPLCLIATSYCAVDNFEMAIGAEDLERKLEAFDLLLERSATLVKDLHGLREEAGNCYMCEDWNACRSSCALSTFMGEIRRAEKRRHPPIVVDLPNELPVPESEVPLVDKRAFFPMESVVQSWLQAGFGKYLPGGVDLAKGEDMTVRTTMKDGKVVDIERIGLGTPSPSASLSVTSPTNEQAGFIEKATVFCTLIKKTRGENGKCPACDDQEMICPETYLDCVLREKPVIFKSLLSVCRDLVDAMMKIHAEKECCPICGWQSIIRHKGQCELSQFCIELDCAEGLFTISEGRKPITVSTECGRTYLSTIKINEGPQNRSSRDES